MKTITVISDLHLGDGGKYAIFHAHVPLRGLITRLADSAQEQDLVLLGDVFDYLQIAPFLDFTAQTALAKTEEIIKANPLVFDALLAFLQSPNHRLKWAIGNHDLELLFPCVRTRIEARLGGKQIDWHLDQQAICYEFPAAGGAKPKQIRLVHGNESDAWNAVDYDAVRKIAEKGGSADFKWPLGSVLVANVLNPLKNLGYSYIDLLKPETSVALPLTLALFPEEAGPLFVEALRLFSRVTWEEFKQRLGDVFRGGRPPAFGTFGDEPPASPVDRAAELMGSLVPPDGDREVLGQEFIRWIDDAVAKDPIVEAKTQMFLNGEPEHFGPADILANLLRAAARRNNAHCSSFDLAADDDLADSVRKSLRRNDAAFLVAGHTHLARAKRYPEGYYVNVGTWADLMRLPVWLDPKDFGAWAKRVREIIANPKAMPAEVSPFRVLTSARIESLEGGRVVVQLCREPEAAQVVLQRLG